MKYMDTPNKGMPASMLTSQNTLRTIPQEEIHRFQQKIFSFYQQHKRKLPWRDTTDPYKILLSELMLQQTQVSRVVSYYEPWIARWPTVEALASASRAEVLKAWMGLGYNTRAVYLHQAVQKIVTEFNGDVIAAMIRYKELPGVGRYTAHAVQIFSKNANLVTVDTNIRRIFITEFQLSEDLSTSELWQYAAQCLPQGRSREWHNALMDYGALQQTAKKTGIHPTSKQSQFNGSDRQIRAAILRLLLDSPSSFETIHSTLGEEQMRLRKILGKMVEEEIIVKYNKLYQVKE